MSLARARAWYTGKHGYLLKLAISVSTASVFIYLLDLDRIRQALRHIGPLELLALLLLTVARNAIGSARFRLLSSVIGRIPFFEIMKQYFVASLFNNFLPTAVGGDAVRFAMIAGGGVTKSEAGVTIVLERVVGFYALIAISLVSALLWSPPREILTLVGGLFAAYSLLMSFVVLDGFGWGRRLRNRHLASIRGAFSRYRGHSALILGTFALSVIYQLCSIFISYYVALIIGLQVPVVVFLTFTPLVWFFTMIPISLGGVGLREVSFAYLFALVGVASEDSVAVSLGTYLTLVMSGLLGAIFLFQTRGRRKA